MDRGVVTTWPRPSGWCSTSTGWPGSHGDDEAAEATIFDAVRQGIVPQRLLPEAAGNYFEA
jgi:hypothetical protein